MGKVHSNNNHSAEFIVDGEDFFGKFAECLRWVREHGGAPQNHEQGQNAPVEQPQNSYVRLAYWAMEADTVVERRNDGAHLTLGNALKELADAGFHVDIILWDPGAVTASFGGEANFTRKTKRINTETHDALHGYAQGRISVFLELHPGVAPAQALHQKMALFSANGHLKALVGGFNLEKEYWDTGYHWGTHPITGGGHTLHDTAVLVEGPVTADLEAEWLFHWRRQVPMLGKPDPGVAARASVFAHRDAQPTGDIEITVLTTNPFHKEKDVRDEIVTLISRANHYVYAENFQFCDPAIIKAASKRLKAVENFEVCVVLPDPICDPSKANTYLSRLGYARMGVAACKEDVALLALHTEGQQVPRSEAQRFKTVHAGFLEWNDWLQNEKVAVVDRDTGQKQAQVLLSDITGFEFRDNKPPRVQFYAPVRYRADSEDYEHSTKIYVHSKLMIIDSEHVIIGSANFGFRSMDYDGELSLHIHGAAFANQVKSKLFPHYNVTAMMEVPAALRHDAVAVRNQVRLAPRSPGQLGVKLTDVSPDVQKYMSYTWI